MVDGRIDPVISGKLLEAMRENSKPVPPALLGIIGREHFEARFAAARCEMESFDYRKIADYDDDGIPFVIETAFGWLGDKAEDEAAARHRRELVAGHPQSVPLARPLRHEPRQHPVAPEGRCGRAGDLRAARGLSPGRVSRSRQEQRGGAVMKAAAIISAVEGVTAKWTKQRKREEREASARRNRVNVMVRRRTVTVRDAAWQIMKRPISRPAPTARCRLTPGRSCMRRGLTSRRREVRLVPLPLYRY